jgi:hypothetical protein
MWHRLLQRHLNTHVYCSTIHNSQVMETTKMPHYWQMDQENVIFVHNRTVFNHEEEWNHLQINGWNWRTLFWARLARLRRPKIVCSPSYADFRSRVNTAVLLDLGHMRRIQHIWEVWELVENPKPECVWFPHSRGTKYTNLKVTEVNTRRGSGTSVKIS